MLTCDDRRHYVNRLVFSPAQISDHYRIGKSARHVTGDHELCSPGCERLSKQEQQLQFQDSLKKRIDRNSHTHNDSELRLIRYLGNHAHAMEAQKLLFTNDTVVKLLARIFRHLPNMHNIDVFTVRSYVGGAKLARSFEGFSPLELDYSGRTTLKSLFTALDEAPVRIYGLGFITNRMLCPTTYDEDYCDLDCSKLAQIQRRRRDIGLSKDLWTDDPTVYTLPSALRGWGWSSLLNNLHEFRLYLDSNYRVLTGGPDEFGDGIDSDLYPGLNKVFKDARNVDRLEFGLNSNSCEDELETGLDVGAVFRNAYLTRIKHVELRHCQPKKLNNVLKLFQTCADVLEKVYIEDNFNRYDLWRKILEQLKKHKFPSLKRFDLYDYKWGGFYDAGPYLQGLEADNPIPEHEEDRWRLVGSKAAEQLGTGCLLIPSAGTLLRQISSSLRRLSSCSSSRNHAAASWDQPARNCQHLVHFDQSYCRDRAGGLNPDEAVPASLSQLQTPASSRHILSSRSPNSPELLFPRIPLSLP